MNRFLEFLKDTRKMKAFLMENKDMLIKVAAAVVLVVAAFFMFILDGADKPEAKVEEPTAADEAPETALIYVDIGGEVVNPMVAELKEGSRVEDAIKAAGGVTEHADLTEINRAAFVEDGEKIYIPPLPVVLEDGTLHGEEITGERSMYAYSDGRININTADSDALQQLNGVGPATAEKIIDYREANGRFSSIEEIMNVSGIGEKTFEKFKDEIKV